MMQFYPEDIDPPTELKTRHFYIRPLRATDVKLDFNAVIASREILLRRTFGRWPKEGFTIDENLEDLKHHEKMHDERKEFTFTVMNPTETRCLGCLYIFPINSWLRGKMTPEDLYRQNISDFEAGVSFWVIPSCVEKGLDKFLLEELIRWFKDKWVFSRVVFEGGTGISSREKELLEQAELKPVSFDSIIGWQIIALGGKLS